jgi:fructose-1,6-bisphosphatase/inositol monophosphatase family enzyme
MQTYNALSIRNSLRKPAGSVALAMAHLAVGSYDALILKPKKEKEVYDIVGGIHLMKNAGIIIKDYDWREFNIDRFKQGIIAYKPCIEQEIKKVYEECLKQ